MKTTDGAEVKKKRVYYFIKDNKINKVQCTDIHIGNDITYLFSMEYYGKSYYPSELRGILYKSYDKAKNRLQRSLKKTIKNYEKILEELNA